MGMLGPDDPLSCPLNKIVVAGGSGAGKTTLCREISARLGVPHVEIDSLYHGPEWTPRPEFAADVDRITAGPEWAIEYTYRSVKPLLVDRMDLMVWLDHPRRTVIRRVVSRTVSRRLRRTELWNGNREAALWTILTDHDHIVRWSWRVYGRYRAEIPALATADGGQLTIVRLVGQRQVDAWLAGPFATAATTRSSQEVSSSPPPEE